eukprot:4289091-Prorocentrum_lima.AAC.1
MKHVLTAANFLGITPTGTKVSLRAPPRPLPESVINAARHLCCFFLSFFSFRLAVLEGYVVE